MASERNSRTRPETLSRRDLLGGGAAAGAAVAATGAAGAAEAAHDEPDDDPRRLTYRETEHVRAFYRRSRI